MIKIALDIEKYFLKSTYLPILVAFHRKLTS